MPQNRFPLAFRPCPSPRGPLDEERPLPAEHVSPPHEDTPPGVPGERRDPVDLGSRKLCSDNADLVYTRTEPARCRQMRGQCESTTDDSLGPRKARCRTRTLNPEKHANSNPRRRES